MADKDFYEMNVTMGKVMYDELYKEDKLGDSIYRELTEENPVDKYDNPIDSGRELIVNVTGLRFNPITEVKTENVLTEEGSTETPVETSGTMAQYMSAIGKDVKRSKK